MRRVSPFRETDALLDLALADDRWYTAKEVAAHAFTETTPGVVSKTGRLLNDNVFADASVDVREVPTKAYPTMTEPRRVRVYRPSRTLLLAAAGRGTP